MDVSVDEAIAVLRAAAKSPRAQAALDTLQTELSGPAGKGPTGKPSFPTNNDFAARMAAVRSARGSHSQMARGTATARKGT